MYVSRHTNWFIHLQESHSGGFFMSFLKIIINNCILYYKKYYICTIKEKQLNKNIMTIQSETKKRTDLVNDPKFRTHCAKLAKQLGITEDMWNKDKVAICLMFANEIAR